MFDIALDNESKRPRTSAKSDANSKSGGNSKRQKKDEKYGHGGKKRFGKSNDAQSTSDMRDFSVSRMKGKDTGAKKRLGKARRAKGRG
jgi:rRNA-processing protein EBP2